jgi:hypothetical protein
MSDNEGGESRSMGAFLLGFLTGLLVCLVVGGALFIVQGRRSLGMMRMEEMRARHAAEQAAMEAAMERNRALAAKEEARLAREKADKALRESTEGKQKGNKER